MFGRSELGPEAQAEAVQEAVANALVAYARLVEQGRKCGVRDGVGQICMPSSGRQVGGRLNAQDISSSTVSSNELG
jgi:hypothetical protein